MTTTVVCWNIAKRWEPWRQLAAMDADVALLQEAGMPPPDMAESVNTGPAEHWDSHGWNSRWWQGRFENLSKAGIEERVTALESVFSSVGDTVLGPLQDPPRASLDDRIDAAAAAWTARRIASGEAICLGEGEFDATGYPMNIWI